MPTAAAVYPPGALGRWALCPTCQGVGYNRIPLNPIPSPPYVSPPQLDWVTMEQTAIGDTLAEAGL